MSSKQAISILIILIGVGFIAWRYTNTAHAPAGSAAGVVTMQTTRDEEGVRNLDFSIDGEAIHLQNGIAEVAVANSASKVITRYFGNEAWGDFNGDGLLDVAFLVTQDGGGSGTFYYVVVGMGSASGLIGTNALLLGDRIAPQTTEIKAGKESPVVVVNYADRKPKDPMSATPSVGVSRTFRALNGSLTELKK